MWSTTKNDKSEMRQVIWGSEIKYWIELSGDGRSIIQGVNIEIY